MPRTRHDRPRHRHAQRQDDTRVRDKQNNAIHNTKRNTKNKHFSRNTQTRNTQPKTVGGRTNTANDRHLARTLCISFMPEKSKNVPYGGANVPVQVFVPVMFQTSR